jgi:hypothetical protein
MNETNNPENISGDATPSPTPSDKISGGTRIINPIISEDSNSPIKASINVGTNYHSDEEDSKSQVGGFIDKPINSVKESEKVPIDQDDTDNQTTVLAIKVIIVIIGIVTILQGLWEFTQTDKSIPPPVHNFSAALTVIFGLGLLFRKDIIRKIVIIITSLQLVVLIFAFIGVIILAFAKPDWFSEAKNTFLIFGGIVSLVIYIATITILSLKKVKAAFS